MKTLTTKEKLNLVLELTKKHNITAYQIGNNTSLDASAVHRILTGEVKKPRDRTLSEILVFIENTIVGSNIPGHENFAGVEEKEEKYLQTDQVLTAISNLRDMIKGNQNLVGKALEIILLNTDEIRDETTGLKDRLQDVDTGVRDLNSAVNKSLAARNS